MTKENIEKLKTHLKEKQDCDTILFFDKIDHKRVDITIAYEIPDDYLMIVGDECEMYELDELELIDNRILNNDELKFLKELKKDLETAEYGEGLSFNIHDIESKVNNRIKLLTNK